MVRSAEEERQRKPSQTALKASASSTLLQWLGEEESETRENDAAAAECAAAWLPRTGPRCKHLPSLDDQIAAVLALVAAAAIVRVLVAVVVA
jgi:hypothetical protein